MPVYQSVCGKGNGKLLSGGNLSGSWVCESESDLGVCWIDTAVLIMFILGDNNRGVVLKELLEVTIWFWLDNDEFCNCNNECCSCCCCWTFSNLLLNSLWKSDDEDSEWEWFWFITYSKVCRFVPLADLLSIVVGVEVLDFSLIVLESNLGRDCRCWSWMDPLDHRLHLLRRWWNRSRIHLNFFGQSISRSDSILSLASSTVWSFGWFGLCTPHYCLCSHCSVPGNPLRIAALVV